MSWLDTLNARAARALRLLGPDTPNWVQKRPELDHNVVIVGGGQSGICHAFALRRLGIGNVSVIDAAEGDRVGVWLTQARMETLRTPKTATGPELGIPDLCFEAWFEAQHGPDAFSSIEFIKREDWASYLNWFQQAAGVPVRYGTRLTRVEPYKGYFRLHLDEKGVQRIETARKIIFATGIIGCGVPNVPAPFSTEIPTSLLSHTWHDIDFSRLRNKIVAVIGSASSALDAAAVALENEAAQVHMFCRKDKVANGGLVGFRASAGTEMNFQAMPDELRWYLAVSASRSGAAPPPNSLRRVARRDNFYLHLGSPWHDLAVEEESIRGYFKDTQMAFDHVILGTGYRYSPRYQLELSEFSDKIATWADRYEAPASLQHKGLGTHPYLGSGFEFTEKHPGEAPFLKNIHCFAKAGTLGFGRSVGDIPSLKIGVQAVVATITRDFLFDDYAYHKERMLSPARVAFPEEIYAKSIWAPEQASAS